MNWLSSQILSSGHELAESPRWGLHSGMLHWVDIETSHLYSLAQDGSTKGIFLEQGATSVHELTEQTLIVTGFNSIFTVESGRVDTLWREPDAFCDWRFNDSYLLPSGELLVGTKSLNDCHEGQRLGALVEGELKWLYHDFSLTNGIAFDEQKARLYVSDSKFRRILVWDIQGGIGELARSEPQSLPVDFQGEPDGLVLDREGNLWVAEWGTGRILILDSNGVTVDSLQVQTPNVSSLAWIDGGFTRLCVTTASSDHSLSLASGIPCKGGDVIRVVLEERGFLD